MPTPELTPAQVEEQKAKVAAEAKAKADAEAKAKAKADADAKAKADADKAKSIEFTPSQDLIDTLKAYPSIETVYVYGKDHYFREADVLAHLGVTELPKSVKVLSSEEIINKGAQPAPQA